MSRAASIHSRPRPTVRSTLRHTLGVADASPRGSWGTGQVFLVLAVTLLNVLGLAMVLSVSSVTSVLGGQSTWFYVVRNGIWITLGTVVCLTVRAIDYRVWRRLVPLAVLGSLTLLVVVLVPGVGSRINGARSWIGVGPLTFQPAELFKLAMLVYAADLLSRRSDQLDLPERTLVPVLTVFSAGAALIMFQPDLGSLIVAGAIVIAVLFCGGVRLAPLALCTGAGIAAASAFALSEPYRRNRLLAFVDPWSDPENVGYQTIQSLVGIADGGLTGVGIGEGRAKWGYLPEAHTDFIYAVIAEEMGLIGALLVLGLFVVLAIAGIRIALHAPDRFGTLAAIGVVVWLIVQAVVNIGAVIGVLPITGIPLPFVSFGGTSLIVGMAAIGLLLNIGRQGHA